MSSTKIATKDDIFLKVAKKRGITIEKVDEIYQAFLKGAKDKIIAEDKLTFELAGIGSLYLNLSETRYELTKRKILTKEVSEIDSEFDKSLKRRYLLAQKFVDDYKNSKKEDGLFPNLKFVLPFCYSKAIHFYTSFKYHKENYKGRSYNYTLGIIEGMTEKIFYEEDARFNN